MLDLAAQPTRQEWRDRLRFGCTPLRPALDARINEAAYVHEIVGLWMVGRVEQGGPPDAPRAALALLRFCGIAHGTTCGAMKPHHRARLAAWAERYDVIDAGVRSRIAVS